MSRQRLLSRFDLEGGRWVQIALACVALVAVVIAIGEFRSGGGLVDLEDAEGDYRALVVVAQASCEADVCVFGNGAPNDPPRETRALMARLRVRSVSVDRWSGVTAFSADYVSRPTLLYAPPGRAREQWSESGVVVGRRGSVEPIRDGWFRVIRR